MGNVIALNSGGFDSIVMINQLCNTEGYKPISLFFNWGQPNYMQESLCAWNVAKKYNLEHIEVEINMPWVNTNMEDKVYIPMRNLVFASYAVSLAEQRGIDEVFMAIIKNSDTPFFDCTEEFYKNLNTLIEGSNIKIQTPYIEYSKYDLIPLVKQYNIKESDFFSCNTPKFRHECGKCGDCLVLKDVFGQIHYQKAKESFKKHGYNIEFIEEFRQTPITMAKLYINNSCNMRCKHCFLNDVKLEGNPMTDEQIIHTIDEIADCGIGQIDLFGKEVLVNDKVFNYIDYIHEKYPNITVTMITNGLNVPKYREQLKDARLGDIAISLESLEEVHSRTSNSMEAIKVCLEDKLPVSVTIDLTNDNYMDVKNMILHLNDMGVVNFYVKPIIPVGNTNPKDATNPDIIIDCLEELADLELKHDGFIEFGIKYAHTEILKNHPNFKDIYNSCIENLNQYKNIAIWFEHYCESFNHAITIMADGEVLGCGYEINSDYKKHSVGNILDKKLCVLIHNGKQYGIGVNRVNCEKGCVGCYHSPNFYYKK